MLVEKEERKLKNGVTPQVEDFLQDEHDSFRNDFFLAPRMTEVICRSCHQALNISVQMVTKKRRMMGHVIACPKSKRNILIKDNEGTRRPRSI